jgi:hypothetical protein
MSKYKNDPDMETCPLCGGTDNQDHYTRQCSHPDVMVTRREGLVPLQNLVAKAIKTCTRLGEFAIRLQRVAIGKFSVDPDEQLDAFHGISLWSGMINAHTESMLEKMTSRLFQDERSQAATITFIRRFCSILTDVMSRVWKKRCQLWTDPDDMVTDIITHHLRERTTIDRVARRRGEINPTRSVVEVREGSGRGATMESYKRAREVDRKQKAYKAMKKCKGKDKTGEKKRQYRNTSRSVISSVNDSAIAAMWRRRNESFTTPSTSLINDNISSTTNFSINKINIIDTPYGDLGNTDLCVPNAGVSTTSKSEPRGHREGDRTGIG